MHFLKDTYTQRFWCLLYNMHICILVFTACMYKSVCIFIRKQCIIKRLLKRNSVSVYRDYLFPWSISCVHRILPGLYELLLVGTGQIICIYLLFEQWETAGNHRCHHSIVYRALIVALVSLRCKSHANITNEWKTFTVWRSLKTKHPFGSFRMAVGGHSPLCLSLHWKQGSSDVLPF